MTVINGVEIDDIAYLPDDIHEALKQNTPISSVLHLIASVSNPCNYARRYKLAAEFMERMKTYEPNAKLYFVEVAYGEQPFVLTSEKNPQHLQIRTDSPALWLKECCWNAGIRKLLPNDWKAVACIDADIIFESTNWISDTLKVLNGCRDVVQLFSHACDLGPSGEEMAIYPSFGYSYTKHMKYNPSKFHPGYCIGFTRNAFEQMGGLYDLSILGSGDHNLCFALVQRADASLNSGVHPEYRRSLKAFEARCVGLSFGYIPGVIRHNYHGSKQNRRYNSRWRILVKYYYQPTLHITRDEYGLLTPSVECPPGLIEEIAQYFAERKEDDV